MKNQNERAVVCLDGSRVSAVLVTIGKGGEIEVRSGFSEVISGLNPSDTAAGAERVRRALDDAGFPRSNIMLALPRHEVIIKRFTIPCGELEDGSLAPMVRLKLGRESSIVPAEELIDFSVTNRENQSATVLVGAVKKARAEYLIELLRLAGRKVGSVRVRTDGLAGFLDPDETALAITTVSTGGEFAVIDRGLTVFSRACLDATSPEQIRVEADRTMISSNSSDPKMRLSAPVLVMPKDAQCPREWRHLSTPFSLPGLRVPPSLADLALLGLAVEREGPHRIDFLNAQQPKDLGAPARQRTMLVALLLIAMVGTSYVLGKEKSARLDDSINVATASLGSALGAYREGLTARSRYRHQKEWTEARVDWAAHLELLIGALPDPGEVTLNEISMRSESRVLFEPGEKTALPGSWDREHRLRLLINGDARSRDSIEQLRESMLTLGELSINGADTETAFSLELTTDNPSPRVGDSQ